MISSTTTMTQQKSRKNALRAVTTSQRIQPLASRVTSDEDQRQAMQDEPPGGRPYPVRTINAYKFAVVALGHWMTEEKIPGDFTSCSVLRN
ncbi:hypothetical protein [Streptomyces hokutonensis]|uniref:Uncharacterized protein n=1 Tax=Streptomyces hokutonensis TaxID=1306990 RepID=A0ABW6MKL1_9ACTN